MNDIKIKLLQENNDRMKEIIEKQRDTIFHQEQQLKDAQTEMNSAMRILWSATKSVGGIIEISDNDMARADYTSSLTTSYDPDKNATILTATSETPN